MMEDENFESSKFYSYKFNNFSIMIILPAFILLLILFVSSFFVIRENTVNGVGMIVPNSTMVIKSNGNYEEGQKLNKGSNVKLLNGNTKKVKYNTIVHLDNEKTMLLPDIKNYSKLKVVTYAPASEISLISKNQKLQFQVESRQGGTTILSGYVDSIGIYPVQQKNIYGYKVEGVIVPSKKNLSFLRYGMHGKVSIITGKTSYFNYIKSKVLEAK